MINVGHSLQIDEIIVEKLLVLLDSKDSTRAQEVQELKDLLDQRIGLANDSLFLMSCLMKKHDIYDCGNQQIGSNLCSPLEFN